MSAAALERRDALLIFGGVYGNRQALRAVCAAARAAKIPPRNFVITGDLAAYCADGARVAAFCQSELAEAVIIRGNCERALAEDADGCGCGFDESSVCHLLSLKWYAHARASIPASLKKWMGALPPRADLRFGGRRIAVFHADGDSDNAFVFPSSAGKGGIIARADADGVIAGHSGIPFSEITEKGVWHNSGALGMPANDGTARTWYAVWRETADGIVIRHRALSYDFAAAARAMRGAGLPPDYQQTLAGGIWPSDSILPPAEKRRQGIALAPPDCRW